MNKVGWYVHRLRTMGIKEVGWRCAQKALELREAYMYGKCGIPVTEVHCVHEALHINSDALGINLKNTDYKTHTSIPLLGEHNYEPYKKDWHAGFGTPNKWPIVFSHSLDYKQRDDIGDARTNWELNRHFQFALLAKDYYATRDGQYLRELAELFDDWNKENPFLWGISWTSAMEVAIRISNWCYAYCFLCKAEATPKSLLEGLRRGILVMTHYLTKHYSRHSSANNHLVVEMYAIGMVGVLTGNGVWVDLAVRTLTYELPRQNYSDGVNKELSLHYQSFYMEAMGLMWRLMLKNGITVPEEWTDYLVKMSDYLYRCVGPNGELIEFGDNDEGKLLDLQGTVFDHYTYVLELMSHLLPERYVTATTKPYENLHWLFTKEERVRMMEKPLRNNRKSVCYKEGGNSILHSKDGRAIVGIDHAALGFGAIAAHGHSDALSFVMYIDGIPLFTDAGTYIYHCDIKSRNSFRSTRNHNTVCIEGRDQSEMLGAFLWGRKAKCRLLGCNISSDKQTIEAEHNGYKPIMHRRKFSLENGRLAVEDTLSNRVNAVATLMLHPSVNVKDSDGSTTTLVVANGTEVEVQVEGGHTVVVEAFCSPRYGVREKTKALKTHLVDKELRTIIEW